MVRRSDDLTAFRDFTVTDLAQNVALITQCTSYSGATGECDTSMFQISDVVWGPIRGTLVTDSVAAFQCSEAAPCPGIALVGVDVATPNSSAQSVVCSNVVDPVGFECSTSTGS